MRLFKSLLLLSMCIIFTIQAQSGSRTAVYGGLAMAAGEGASGMNPGIVLGLESGDKLGNYVGIGGHVDYEWVTANPPAGYGGMRLGVHLWDVSFVPKVFIPFTETSNMSFEVDPGFCLSLAYLHSKYFSDNVAKPHFILTPGITFNIDKLLLAFKIKRIFGEGGTANFLTFNIGYNLD